MIRTVVGASFLISSLLIAGTPGALSFFPETTLVRTFTAAPHTNRMSALNLLGSKDLLTSIGGQFPIVGWEAGGIPFQAALAASVHFELHPQGQAQVVSDEYYIDFVTLDASLSEQWKMRWVAGHTSHHLSDNWFERLGYTQAVRYSRDYVKAFIIWQPERMQWYAGADYAHHFTIGTPNAHRWNVQTGFSADIYALATDAVWYVAGDLLLRQEARSAATNTLQTGLRVPMRRNGILRFVLQYRTGVDDRGQFFPQHRSLLSAGITIE